MGNCIGRDPSRPPGVDAASVAGPVQYPAGLSSYMEACRFDLELQTFDTTIQRRTSRAIGSLVRGVEVNALSLGSFNEVTGCLLEMNQEVVKFILERNKDTWKDPELRILVDDYFENSLRTLDFYASLQKCLKRARDSQFIIEVALRRFTEEEAQEDVVKKYERTLEELKQFKAAGSPFTKEFFQELQSVYRQQLLMLEKLQLRKSKIDKKLKRIDAWKKVSSIIFVATVATVLICSIVAAAVAAPPVAAALAAAAAIPIGSMGKWIDSLFQDYINAWKGQEELITSMEARTVVTIMDLDSIRVLSDNLEIQIRSLLDNAEFALRDSEALKLGINEIMKKLELFMRSIQDLGEQADKCTRDIIRARTVVLNKIIKAPS